MRSLGLEMRSPGLEMRSLGLEMRSLGLERLWGYQRREDDLMFTGVD